MAYEITGAGMSTQTLEEVIDGLAGTLRTIFGVNLNTSTSSIMGQIVNTFAEVIALHQQTGLASYNANDVNSAIGVALDRLMALTATIRKGADSSTVNGTLKFSGAATVNDGDLILNEDTNDQWQAINGPYTSVAGEDVPATFQAVATGPLLAQAGTAWSPVTIIANWDDFENPADDANLGRDQETDPDARVRRQVELYAQNLGSLNAIKGVVSKVDGVTTVQVYHNPSVNPVDASGIPFKAFNVVVETTPSSPPVALQNSIGDAILSVLGAGGEAFGTDFNITRPDIEGFAQPVGFDLITEATVWITVGVSTLNTEQSISPIDQAEFEDVIEAALLGAGQTLYSQIGRDQLAFNFAAVINDLQAQGQIAGVTAITVELSLIDELGPFFDPLPIGRRERPAFDSPRINVTRTP